MVSQFPDGDVEFRFFRPDARLVSLIGDFNGWDRLAHHMRRQHDGWWSCQLCLDPGVYQFQYLADGMPYLDFAAFGVELGPLGGWNSVVFVAEQVQAQTSLSSSQASHIPLVAGREA